MTAAQTELIVRLGGESELVVPEGIARLLGLCEGDKVWADLEGDRVVIERDPPLNPYERLRMLTKGWFTEVDPIAYQDELRRED